MPAAPVDREQAWAELTEEIQNAQVVFACIWAPSHYTFLREDQKPVGWVLQYKDSLAAEKPECRAAAQRVLDRLQLGVLPARSNAAFQGDNWSCGAWVIRWVEEGLRELADPISGR